MNMDPVLNVATPIRARILMINKCFAGVKTGGKCPPSRGETAKKRMQEKVFQKKTKAE